MKQRYESIILRELSSIIHEDVMNSNINFVTITEVMLSNDYSYADIYVQTNNNLTKQLESLNHIEPFLRRQLSKKLKNLRKVPKLRFHFDDKLNRKNRIDQVLDEIKKAH